MHCACDQQGEAMSHFRTKLHILNYLHQEFDDDEIVEFAELVEEHPLNDFAVKTSGDTGRILNSLRTVPKAILEDVLAVYMDDSEDDDEEGEESDEDEEEEDSEDD